MFDSRPFFLYNNASLPVLLWAKEREVRAFLPLAVMRATNLRGISNHEEFQRMNRVVNGIAHASSSCTHSFSEISIEYEGCSVQYSTCSRCGRCKLWICKGKHRWPEVGVKTLAQAQDALISVGEIMRIPAGVLLALDARMAELFPATISTHV